MYRLRAKTKTEAYQQLDQSLLERVLPHKEVEHSITLFVIFHSGWPAASTDPRLGVYWSSLHLFS
jgi:hypothetical protein